MFQNYVRKEEQEKKYWEKITLKIHIMEVPSKSAKVFQEY